MPNYKHDFLTYYIWTDNGFYKNVVHGKLEIFVRV